MSFRIHSETTLSNFLEESTNDKFNEIKLSAEPSRITNYKLLDSYMENIEVKSPVIKLKQNNFNKGTYRIRKSGYYMLTEDILFNPNPSVWDGNKLVGDDWNPTESQITGGKDAEYPVAPYGPYHLGFFAAISVEANNVIIDLNSFTISQSLEHYLQQRFFSIIELTSSPFIVSQGPSNFGSPVVFSNYVKIKNGNFGLSSHSAIHGNGMSNIILEDLNIYDYEQAGIGLNGVETLIIRNVNIGKNSRNVYVNAQYSQARFIRSFLKDIINKGGDPSIIIKGVSKTGSELLSELVSEMDVVYNDVVVNSRKTTSSLFKNDSLLLDGSVYGIILNVLGVAVNDFLKTLDGKSGNHNIFIENLNISNLDSKSVEVIGISADNNNSSYGANAQKGPVGDVFRIVEVTDSNGFYIPNVLSNAQCYTSKYKSFTSSKTASINSNIYDTWISSDTPLDPLIINNYYICGIDSMAHVMKGNIGLFLSGCRNLQMYNVRIDIIKNDADLGNTDKCQPNTPKYNGNTTRGMAVVVNRNLYIKGIEINNISSRTADCIGVDFIGKTDYVKMEGYNIINIDQNDILSGGKYPNSKISSYIFYNKQNVDELILQKVI